MTGGSITTVSGNASVTANEESDLDARSEVATAAKTGFWSPGSSSASIGMTIAVNSIGYDPDDATWAVDAIIGTSFASESQSRCRSLDYQH